MLLVEYAQTQSHYYQMCEGPGCGGLLPDYGLYNAVGLVLVAIGLIQIAASFYVARTLSPTQHAMVNPPI